MPQFPANPHRSDPYRGFKFHIVFDGPEPVAGLSKCGALKKSTEVVEFREGGDQSHSRKMPGQSKYEPITLEQGLTHDTTFEDWANLVNNYTADGDMSLKNFRKDVRIDLINLQGQIAKSYFPALRSGATGPSGMDGDSTFVSFGKMGTSAGA